MNPSQITRAMFEEDPVAYSPFRLESPGPPSARMHLDVLRACIFETQLVSNRYTEAKQLEPGELFGAISETGHEYYYDQQGRLCRHLQPGNYQTLVFDKIRDEYALIRYRFDEKGRLIESSSATCRDGKEIDRHSYKYSYPPNKPDNQYTITVILQDGTEKTYTYEDRNK